jgi:uncharacterized lipoprotein YmbA
MKITYKKTVVLLLTGCSLLMSGCASSPQSRFYTLTATALQATGPVDRDAPSIAIASITIPELVNRPQMVIRTDGPLVEMLETHRWAEPLKTAIPLTIAENISRILATDNVSSYPQNAFYSADFKIYLDFQRFESVGEYVLLDALWTIRRSDEKPPQSGRSKVREKVTGSDYEAVAAAFSTGLGSISREIALALKNDWPTRK